MSTEDRLRDALSARAATVQPSEDGWARIEARTARRRPSVTRWIALALAAAAIPGALAVNAAMQDDDSTPLVVNPGPSTTTSTTATPTANVDYAIWPTAEMSVSYDSPAKLAQNFARQWLGMTSPTVGAYRAGDARSGEVDIHAFAGGVATTLTVREDGVRGWRVLEARSPNLELATPEVLDAVASPIMITGRSVAFEGVVHVTLLALDGTLSCGACSGGAGPDPHRLGQTTFTGHGTELAPFTTTLTFGPNGNRYGVLILWTDSARDGSIAEATTRLVAFP